MLMVQTGLDDLSSLNLAQAVPAMNVSAAAAASSTGSFMANLIFGAIGGGIFVYGIKSRHWKALVVGVALSGLPYVITNTLWTCVVGVGLCVLLYFFPEV